MKRINKFLNINTIFTKENSISEVRVVCILPVCVNFKK